MLVSVLMRQGAAANAKLGAVEQEEKSTLMQGVSALKCGLLRHGATTVPNFMA